MTISEIFGTIDQLSHLNVVQIILLLCGYMFLLIKASSLIDYGSGMLMLVLEPGIICGLILPVLSTSACDRRGANEVSTD